LALAMGLVTPIRMKKTDHGKDWMNSSHQVVDSGFCWTLSRGWETCPVVLFGTVDRS
jgi:hypothetical protein